MLNYEQVIEAMENEGRRIGQLAEECADVAQNAGECEADYKFEFAKTRIVIRDDSAKSGSKITVGEVDDLALVRCYNSYRSYLLAQGSLTAIRDALRASQARLDALRTIASGYRQAGG